MSKKDRLIHAMDFVDSVIRAKKKHCKQGCESCRISNPCLMEPLLCQIEEIQNRILEEHNQDLKEMNNAAAILGI